MPNSIGRIFVCVVLAGCGQVAPEESLLDSEEMESPIAGITCPGGPTAATCAGGTSVYTGLYRVVRSATQMMELAQTFEVPRGGYAGQVTLKLRRLRDLSEGEDADLRISVRALASGSVPAGLGTELAFGTLPASAIGRGRAADHVVVLGPANPATPQQLQPGTTYALVLSAASPGPSGAIVLGVASQATGTYGEGTLHRRRGTNPGGDFSTQVFQADAGDLSFALTLGDGADIDECTLGLDDCDADADCANTNGSFTCACRTGFTGDGRTCLDHVPDAASFTAQADQNLSAVATSAGVTLAGYEGPMPVSVSGDGSPQLSVAGGAWAASANISPGQTLAVRLTTAATYSTARTATLTAGFSTFTWTATTKAQCPAGCTTSGSNQCVCSGTGCDLCPAGAAFNCGMSAGWQNGTASACNVPGGWSHVSGDRSCYRHGGTPGCTYTLVGSMAYSFVLQRQ